MRRRDHIAKLAGERLASRRRSHREASIVVIGNESFTYQAGELVAYENQGVTLDRRERNADAMEEAGS